MGSYDPEVYNRIKLVGGQMVAAMLAANPGANHSRGATYIVRLPNSNIKIGVTTKQDLVAGLVGRWQDLSRKYDGIRVEPLCTLHGGKTLEALLHYRFSSASVFEEFGEQYYATHDLLSFAVEEGHCPIGAMAVAKFTTYTPRKK